MGQRTNSSCHAESFHSLLPLRVFYLASWTVDTCFKFKKRRCADLDLHPLHLVEHGHLRGVLLLVLVDDLVQHLHVNVCRASIAGLHQVDVVAATVERVKPQSPTEQGNLKKRGSWSHQGR